MTLGTINRGVGDTPTVITIPTTPVYPTATPTPEYNPLTGTYTPTVDQMLQNLPLNSPASTTLDTTVLNEALNYGASAATPTPSGGTVDCTSTFNQYFSPSCGTPYGLYAVLALAAAMMLSGGRRR